MRLTVAVLVAATVILCAPLAGQLRSALRSRFPDQFRLVVVGIVVAALVAAALAAYGRVRDRRAPRFGAMLAALTVGLAYVVVFRTGNSDVDVVEAFHFVEYGVVVWLFYRVWQPRGDPSILLWPLAAGLVVATGDEWLQWFVPGRTGEVRDVVLNGVALVCGLGFSLGAEPPASFTWSPRRGSRVGTGLAGGVVVLVVGLFVSTVHVGFAVGDPVAGTLRSRYDGAALDQAATDRRLAWATRPPASVAPLSREDQYLAEAFWHVERRNALWASGDKAEAWQENGILERFFAPVLETPTYATPAGARWSPEQRLDGERAAGAAPRPSVSEAHPFPIYLWPRPVVLAVVVLGAAAVLVMGVRGEYNARDGTSKDEPRRSAR